MPLPIPALDDRTFDQLVEEAKILIPKHFPAWTDHNFSDPGIAFMELFAFLIENAIYQINRVPDRSLEHFASLLGVARASNEPSEMLFRRVREKLDSRERAITKDEIEEQILARPGWPRNQKIARAAVIADLQAAPGLHTSELTLKIVIVPEANSGDEFAPEPTDELRQAVYEFLRERVPIGTRLQVLAPQYSAIHLEAAVVRGQQSRLDRATVRQNVIKAVRDFLHPTRGGDDGHGWPFGRSIFRSELYAIIEGLPGVDHVRELLLRDAQLRLGKKVSGKEVYTYASPAPQPDRSEATRSELVVRDSRFPQAEPLVEWRDEPFAAIVGDDEVKLKASFVVNVVDE
jgi:Baseplate J-like protein